MLRMLRPHLYIDSVHRLSGETLRQWGIRGLIMDLDNTLTPWREGPNAGVIHWLRDLEAAGLRLCILSNNDSSRVGTFSKAVGVPAIAKAAKPRRRNFRMALRLLGTTARETAVVGDQIFTDVLGGNRSGLKTVLVRPLHGREFVGTRFIRKVERMVLSLHVRRGLLLNGEFDA